MLRSQGLCSSEWTKQVHCGSRFIITWMSCPPSFPFPTSSLLNCQKNISGGIVIKQIHHWNCGIHVSVLWSPTLYFSSLFLLLHLRKYWKMAQVLGFLLSYGRPEWVPGSWLQGSSALTIMVIWEVTQEMKDLLSWSLSVTQFFIWVS